MHARLPIAMLAAATVVLCGPARAAEQSRTLAPFTAIANGGPVGLDIEVGKPQSVTVTGNDRFLTDLRTDVVDGQLRIELQDHDHDRAYGHPHVTITLPRLERFEMSGAGATVITHMAGDRLDVRYSGAGSLRADGQVKALRLDVSGVGSIDARELHAESAEVHVSGVGSVRVHASERLDASVGGIGSLAYYGHPKSVETHGGGLGSIGPGH
ncbi:MAG: head GIN domain-containing protein [Burkholderiaceae bacterium]